MEPVKYPIIVKMEKQYLKVNLNMVMEYKFIMMIMAQKLLNASLKMENLIKERIFLTMQMVIFIQEVNMKKEKLQLNIEEFKI